MLILKYSYTKIFNFDLNFLADTTRFEINICLEQSSLIFIAEYFRALEGNPLNFIVTQPKPPSLPPADEKLPVPKVSK